MGLSQFIQFPDFRSPVEAVLSKSDPGHSAAKSSSAISACGVIRRLKGSSQPVLVYGSDGSFYVIKFLDNLQGSNVPFNEALGSEVFRACGLPVPAWAPIWISAEFIEKNPMCWMTTPDGYRKPQPGWCFGSRFLGLQDAPLREILSSQHFGRIRNRMDFWKVRILDALCQHADNRQALFVEDEDRSLDAYFIDHGHLFGGPRGAANPVAATSRYLDKRIYPLITAADWDDIEASLLQINPYDLTRVVRSLPAEWVTPSAVAGLDRFIERLSDPAQLRQMREEYLGSAEPLRVTPRRKPPQRATRPTLRKQVVGAAFPSIADALPRVAAFSQN